MILRFGKPRANGGGKSLGFSLVGSCVRGLGVEKGADGVNLQVRNR